MDEVAVLLTCAGQLLARCLTAQRLLDQLAGLVVAFERSRVLRSHVPRRLELGQRVLVTLQERVVDDVADPPIKLVLDLAESRAILRALVVVTQSCSIRSSLRERITIRKSPTRHVSAAIRRVPLELDGHGGSRRQVNRLGTALGRFTGEFAKVD